MKTLLFALLPVLIALWSGLAYFGQSLKNYVANDQPVIKITSASGGILAGCGNEIIINVFPKPENYRPDLSITNAIAIKNAEKPGVFTIAPNSATKEVSINLRNEGKNLGTETLPVWQVPYPSFTFLNGTDTIKLKEGEPAPGPSSVKIVPIPDPNLLRFYPKDAEYIISEAEIILVRGKRPVSMNRIKDEQSFQMKDLLGMAKPGDRYVISLKQLSRKNFRGQIIPVPGKERVWNIPLY